MTDLEDRASPPFSSYKRTWCLRFAESRWTLCTPWFAIELVEHLCDPFKSIHPETFSGLRLHWRFQMLNGFTRHSKFPPEPPSFTG